MRQSISGSGNKIEDIKKNFDFQKQKEEEEAEKLKIYDHVRQSISGTRINDIK